MTDNKLCAICGHPLTGRQKRYCSPACRAEATRRRAQATYKPSGSLGLYRDKVCPDCGQPYRGHIKTKRCRACQEAANRAADRAHHQAKAHGKARALGSTDHCQRCGQPYTVESGAQKYCPDCAQAANREYHARRMREISAKPEIRAARAERRRREPAEQVCVVCGRSFAARAYALTCGPECRRIHQAVYYAAYDQGRREEKAAYSRARWQAMTEEQRQAINRRARERYRGRKEMKDE